jgi:DNA-binding NarL/FixJ family response regulator
MSAPTVTVLDDHELLAQSVCYALTARGVDARPLQLTDRAALVAAVEECRPDVVLLDLQLGGEVGSGATLVRPFTDAGARVLVVSGVTDPVMVGEALERGAVGYVCKSEPFDVLLDAAERTARGEQVTGPAERAAYLLAWRRHREETAASREMFERLSAREREVLGGICDGESVTTIATRSYVSVATVRTQVRAVLLKLGVGSQLEAAALAHRHGWYDDPQVKRSA